MLRRGFVLDLAGWELLLKHTAPNALYNSSARYDVPKCDEDTRVELTGEIMAWIGDREGPQRLLCMTGAAGSGKSALQQTTSIKCNKCNILGGAFFFSATDPSRNTVETVIPTIAYQLGRRNPTLKQQIKSAVEDEPLIFAQSLEAQTIALIVDPLGNLRDMGINVFSFPYAILIDGLDECKGEDRQAELLRAISRCLLADYLPFRIFIASRPEWAIRTALEPGGHLREMACHIQLSDKYDASADLRRYLQRRFEDIGLHIRDSKWFNEGDIETLVRAASGQFIYVATIYKYISERRASPTERLKIVLTWTPHVEQIARPFEALDILYTNILLAAKNAYEAVDSHHGRDFLLLFRSYHINMRGHEIYNIHRSVSVGSFSVHWLGLEARAEKSLISDLRSLVVLEGDARYGNFFSLRLYHKSFSDFLEDASRAKDLFVSEARVYTHIAKCSMQCITNCGLDFESVPDKWEGLPLPESPKHSLAKAIELLPFFLSRATVALDDEVADFTRNGGWRKIDNLFDLLCTPKGWLAESFKGWITSLRQFTDDVKVRTPEVATVMSGFVEKWERKFKEWDHARKQKNGTDLGSYFGDLNMASTPSDSDLSSDSSVQQPYTNPAALMAHGGATSFFPGASGVQMRDIQYFEASHVTVHTGGNVGDRSIDGWELLLKNIAPNALHDSSARYDAPKCDEDTRVEVIGEIMDWAQDRNAPQRLLCMTGAAGAGKSALQQTIAEHCTKSDILSAAVFFSSADPTRNTVSFVVPTIAYQMGLQHNAFRSSVAAAVRHDRHIFSRSLHSQMDALIVRPFESLRRAGQLDIDTFPHVILIDGLDESNTTSSTTQINVDDRRRAEDRQAELLAAIKHCILDSDLPFHVFIASRPEWAIRSALEPGGHLREVAYHIQLSHKYDASGDMHRYLQRRFEDIGLRISDSKWFSEGGIKTLVRAASGQFIYVATVFKYISERRASPAERLNVVLTWTPYAGQVARPFEALDRLYSNILLAAKNTYEAVDTHHGRDFLLLFRGYEINVAGFMFPSFHFPFRFPVDILSVLLGLKARAAENIVSDLHSLVAFEKDNRGPLCLRLYHKSFSDFLKEEHRAKDLFVPEYRVVMHLAKCMMQHIIECPIDFDSLPIKWSELPLRLLYRCCLMEAVEDLPFFLSSVPSAIDEEVVGFTHNGGWQKIDNLLPLLYRLRSFFYEQFEKWRGCMVQVTRDLRLRRPDVAAVMSQFVDKWEHDVDQWEGEMDSDSDSGDSDMTSGSSDLDLDSDSTDLDSRL
ncbi:hypothetical protein H1R20_g7267, partial [Candolleomyces eurysporus]